MQEISTTTPALPNPETPTIAPTQGGMWIAWVYQGQMPAWGESFPTTVPSTVQH